SWSQPFPHPFQRALAALVDLADSYSVQPAAQANASSALPSATGNSDPVLVPPLYGRWHAQTLRLLTDRDGRPLANADNWVHELNLDPRFRVPAGLGTRVVQDKQEDYMNAAWEQIGDVLEANRRIRFAQLARETSCVWHERHLKPLLAAQPDKFFQVTAPVQKRVVAQGITVFHQ